MKLSVIILNYNVRYYLEQCILSVQAAIKNLKAEIIVVDNNSQDGSIEMLKQNFPEVRLIVNKKNVGFSRGNNIGVAAANGEYICILNPDTVVPEDIFAETLNFAEATSDVGALGVKLIDGRGNFLPESKRNLPTPLVSFQKILKKKADKLSYYATHIHEDEIATVQVLVGAFLLLKKEVYQEVGGLDEDYFMYGEDIDFSYKLTKSGYTNYYFGKAAIIHYKGESTEKNATYLKRFYGAMRIFYKKHFSSNFLFDMLILSGTKLAEQQALLKLKNHKKNKKVSDTIKNHLFLSKKEALLPVLEKKLHKKFQIVPFEVFSAEKVANSFLVFDADEIRYADIIQNFQFLKNKKNKLRIKPQNCNFLLGSDKSDAKGEVSVL